MQRRRYLREAATGVALLAGCGSDAPSGAEALESSWANPAIESTENGLLVVRVVVTNTTSRGQGATLSVFVDIDGGDRHRERREVSLAGNERRVYEVVFDDVTLERYRGNGKIERELD